jgi:nitrogen fixation NifU-like protein
MGIYSKKVIKHFKKPHNYGKIANPDGVGEVGNIICGDVMFLYIKVDKNEVIRDIKFETYGCVAAIATSSVITDLAKNKKVEEALKLNKDSVIETLDKLPPIKIHCSLLAVDALMEAIYDYLSKKKKNIPQFLETKHQIIVKQKKMIEDRYKDWVNLERKKSA